MEDNKKTCFAIRHLQFENLGTFEDPIREADYAIHYLDAPIANLESAYHADLLVILGGPCSAYEETLYPYITKEIFIAKYRLENNLPTLGICLGAQIIAYAQDAKVYAGENGKEIGWAPVALTREGLKSPIAPLAENGSPMFHWHGDTFDLPRGATLLASSERYTNQIFSIGKTILAFQCHPELDPTKIEYWLMGHACELAHTSEVDLAQVRKDTAQYGQTLKENGVRSIDKWLKLIREISI